MKIYHLSKRSFTLSWPLEYWWTMQFVMLISFSFSNLLIFIYFLIFQVHHCHRFPARSLAGLTILLCFYVDGCFAFSFLSIFEFFKFQFLFTFLLNKYSNSTSTFRKHMLTRTLTMLNFRCVLMPFLSLLFFRDILINFFSKCEHGN